jgi:hypothetical protein
MTPEGSGLSVSGVNEKLLYKGGSANMRGVADNSNNGYLIKSVQNTVKQMHSSQFPAPSGAQVPSQQREIYSGKAAAL